MAELVDLEQHLLETVRSLTFEQQQAVLNFALTLSPSGAATPQPPLPLSLQQISKLPVHQRNQLLTPYIQATAQDFANDPTLTEFSVLDVEAWED